MSATTVTDASGQPAEPLRLRLSAIRYAAKDTNLYEFVPVGGGGLPAVEPGAHIGLFLPGGVERQYSVVEAGASPSRYVIGVKLDAGSRGGSRYIHETLRVGAVLAVAPPRNNFPLAEDAPCSVLIAGGIGITPIWCMVQRLAAAGRPWTLYLASRSREEAAFLPELAALGGDVRLHFDQEAGGVFDMASAVAAAPADAHVYCCGPAPMLAAFEAAAASRPADHVHVEYFTAKHERDESGGFTVELARSGLALVVPAGKTILHTVRDAGVEVPSSCEEGVCGACETRVISGIPDHRDAILSQQERAENKTIFICCSGCKTDRLVLDL